MPTRILALFVLLVVLIAACISPAAATVVPIGHRGIEVGFPLMLGWFNGQQAWYVCFGSNNIQWVNCGSRMQFFDKIAVPAGEVIKRVFVNSSFALYPKLKSALTGGSSPVYFVTNFQQGPVFTAMPGQANYSGLWTVNLITWKFGVTPRVICNANDLPTPQEADIVTLDVVIDAPILATGPLTPPAKPSAGLYRIPQLEDAELLGAMKIVFLPAWPAYATDEITRRAVLVYLVITDSADPGLARHLGANYAPALANVDDANTQRVWYFRQGQNPPIPPAQNLVLEHDVIFDPLLFGYVWYRPLNQNKDASPVMNLQPIVRGTIPPYVTVTNPTTLQKFLANHCLELSGPAIKINTFLDPFVEREDD